MNFSLVPLVLLKMGGAISKKVKGGNGQRQIGWAETQRITARGGKTASV